MECEVFTFSMLFPTILCLLLIGEGKCKNLMLVLPHTPQWLSCPSAQRWPCPSVQRYLSVIQPVEFWLGHIISRLWSDFWQIWCLWYIKSLPLLSWTWPSSAEKTPYRWGALFSLSVLLRLPLVAQIWGNTLYTSDNIQFAIKTLLSINKIILRADFRNFLSEQRMLRCFFIC